MRWFERSIRCPELIDRHASVVSLRHFWEWNYYHFHLDVLGKLKLLRDHGFIGAHPLALGRYVRQLPFAAEILQKGRLSKLEWLIPDALNRRLIMADELFYCRVDWLSYRERAMFFLSEMELPAPPFKSSARIFLNREPPATRRIVNFSEIRPVIENKGFQIVDTANLPLDEQIELFSRVRYLAAIYGAGVTNIVYRRGAPLSVLELHSENFISDDMKRISDEFGYAYSRLANDPIKDEWPPTASIFVDPKKLDEALDDLLQT